MCQRGEKIRNFCLGRLKENEFQKSERIAVAMSKSAPFQRLDADKAYCYGLCYMLSEYPEDFDAFDKAQMALIHKKAGMTELAWSADIFESASRYAKLFLLKYIEDNKKDKEVEEFKW